jgi:hypothetical protein
MQKYLQKNKLCRGRTRREAVTSVEEAEIDRIA